MVESKKRTSSTKGTETAKEVRGLIKWWYAYVKEVKERGGHIAWVMYSLPPEILLAMDVVSLSTEQYASACAAKQVSVPFCEKAESEGYSIDLCGYCRTGLGYTAIAKEVGGIPPEAPYGGLQEPDILLGRTFCDPGYKWYQGVQRYFNVPYFVYDDVPAPLEGGNWDDEHVAEHYIKYYAQQMKELVAFLEKHTGRKLDMDKLWEFIGYSQETRRLAYEVNQLRKAIPSPMPSQDWMACIFPFFTMMGTKEASDFFQRLYGEVKHRVDNKIGTIANEKYRLMWQGIPPWHSMEIFNYFEDHGAVFAIESQYIPPMPVELDTSDPLEFLAKRDYWSGGTFVTNQPGKARAGEKSYGVAGYLPTNLLLNMARDYSIDGMVMHYIRSCRLVTKGYLHGQRMLDKHMHIPTFIMEGDMADPRVYAEAQVKAGVDTFMDTVAAAKERRGSPPS